MKNLYRLLNVDEKASKDEILAAYNNIIRLETDENKKNQLRIAIDILLNDEKRNKYDNDLNKNRAEQLLKQVQIKEEPKAEEIKNEVSNTNVEEKNRQDAYNKKMEAMIMAEAQRQLDEKNKKQEKNIENKQEPNFKKIEEEEYRKALKKQEKLRKKQIKKAEQEYKDAYAEAYHAELKKMGYDVKAPWTKKRIKNLIISIIVVILLIFILSKLPFVKNAFIDLYNSNEIIKAVIDIFRSIFGGIEKTIEQM